MAKLHPFSAAQCAWLSHKFECLVFSYCTHLLWPCLEEEEANGTVKAIVHKYFEKENAISKYREPPKLTSKATSYTEHTLSNRQYTVYGDL